MGNQHTTVGDTAVSDPSFLEGLERIGGMGTYQLWKRLSSGEEYEQYNIYSGQGSRLESDRQIYQFRKKQCLNLVAVEHVDIVTNPYSCPGYQQLRVFTERIPLRLKDLQHLPLRYAIYIIKEALVGFKVILSHFGYIPINDNLIGFSSTSKVKVWVNPNFGTNEPHSCFKVKEGLRSDQFNMLSQLFETVETHVVQAPQLEMFKAARLLMRDALDFQSAGIFLANFCIEQRIMLPQKFEISMIAHNIKPHFEREDSVARQTSRIKTYSDASCISSSKGGFTGQQLNFRSSIKKLPVNQMSIGSQDSNSQGRLTFRKKVSSSQPKMKFQAFKSPKHHEPPKLHFTAKKALNNKEKLNSVEKFELPNNDSQNDTSSKSKNIEQLLIKFTPETPTNAKHLANRLSGKDRGVEVDVRMSSENRVRKPGFFANQSAARNSTQMGDFFDEGNRKRNKPLTSSCQPTLELLKNSTGALCHSGLPAYHHTSIDNHRRAGGLASPSMGNRQKLTNSIMMPEGSMPAVPFIHVINPDGDVAKKQSQDSDCQATNIYNSNNSINPSLVSRNERSNDLSSFKTNKFEDKILSSFVAEPHPSKKVSLHDVKNVMESILQESPRNHQSPNRHWELDRFSSEPRVSKYSLFNEKEVFVSQIIKDEKSPVKSPKGSPNNQKSNLLQVFPVPLQNQPDSPCLQNFFAENKLDYEKYKLIMMNRGQKNQLKQSITYEELGRVCDKSRIMDRDNTPMQLDRYAKRDVTKSMTIDEQMFQQSLETQAKMLSSIIVPYSIEEIQEHQAEAFGN